jgi:hypothetical protein
MRDDTIYKLLKTKRIKIELKESVSTWKYLKIQKDYKN